MGMSARRVRFVQEYCVDWNGTQAAIRAGYTEDCAAQTAYDLLRVPEIQAAIEERKEMLGRVAGIDAAWVLNQWRMIAEADPDELSQIRRINCRHCHGFDHSYQWTEAGYMKAVNEAVAKGKEPPDGMGGFGYDQNAAPHPECPECGGHGIERVRLADTGTLRGSAKRLYAGVKQTKDGIQVMTRDQDAALANMAKYFGMVTTKTELSGPNGGPVPVATTLTAQDFTDDQLAAILAAKGTGSDNGG